MCTEVSFESTPDGKGLIIVFADQTKGIGFYTKQDGRAEINEAANDGLLIEEHRNYLITFLKCTHLPENLPLQEYETTKPRPTEVEVYEPVSGIHW